MSIRVIIVALFSFFGTNAIAQSIPFSFRVQQPSSVATVANGSTIDLNAPGIGKTVTARITGVYQGSTSAQIKNAPQFLGSADFSGTLSPSLPITLTPGAAFTLDVQYTPRTGDRATSQVNIQYVELAGVVESSPGLITFSFNGSAPSMVVSYFLATDGNVVPLIPGAKILFDATPVQTTAQATVSITNRGSAAGTVTSISLTGSAFQLIGLPLLPLSVPAGSELRVGIRYSPRAVGTDLGSLSVVLSDQTLTFDIEGSAVGSVFAYDLIGAEPQPVPVEPGGTIKFPDTSLGEHNDIVVRLKNNGTAEGTVSAVAVTGTGYTLSDAPILPAILAPGASALVTITFTPVQAGTAQGRLRIGTDTFELSATALGGQLAYSYGNADAPIKLTSGGVVVFSPVRVAENSKTQFMVRNNGTRQATITSIGLSDTSGVFQIENPPTLPLNLQPGESAALSLAFAPQAKGVSTANLLIDAQTFTLSGIGNNPLPLAEFRFTGASGSQQPFRQPAIGVELPSPYSVDIIGTLTLTTATNGLADDPAVQFSTGARSVQFKINRNTTRAVFPNGANEIQLQTGTVASTIFVTPTFSTASGIDITPQPADPLQFVISPAAPAILSVQVTSLSGTSMTISVTGFSTTRSLDKLNFDFKGTGAFSGAQISVDISSQSASWYQLPSSQSFGGQFLAVVPFTIRSSDAAITSPTDSINSVAVTVTNQTGSSSTVTTQIH